MTVATPETNGPVSEADPSTSPRFVLASVGRPGRVARIMIECPTWCVVDHVENRVVAVEDFTHYGPGTFAGTPTMDDDTTDLHELYVNITSDPASDDPRMRASHLVVSNASASDAHVTDAQGEELASELERMAAEIRQALLVCRQATAA